jgi:hypothetical protein
LRNDEMKSIFTLFAASVMLAGCSSPPEGQNAPAANARAKEMETLAPHAAAVGLAEVTKLREEDSRPSDGDLAMIAELRFLKSSGEVPKEIYIVKEYGGLRPPPHEVEPSPLPGAVRPGSLINGRRYWFAFSSQYEQSSGKYPQGVINFWDEDAKEAEALAAAVREDRFAWNPQHYPVSGLTHSDFNSPEKKEWTIRVQKHGELLWETTRRGVKAKRYLSFGFIPARSLGEPQIATADEFLLAEAAVALPEDNEYDLPAEDCYVKHAYTATSGRKAATWISKLQDGYVERVFRMYDEEGRVRREERSDYLTEGGGAAGGETEAWLRKTVRTFDPTTGEIESEEVFRHGMDKQGNSAWIKVAG